VENDGAACSGPDRANDAVHDAAPGATPDSDANANTTATATATATAKTKNQNLGLIRLSHYNSHIKKH
jgi:hypothetical protein